MTESNSGKNKQAKLRKSSSSSGASKSPSIKRATSLAKAKGQGNTSKSKGLKGFLRRNRVVISAVILIGFVFGAIVVVRDMIDRDRLIYNGLNDEAVEEEKYPESGLQYKYFFQDEYNFKSYDDGSITSKRGIDVSEHQGEINWHEVKKAGVEFAYIRAGYRTSETGSLREDACFRYNIEQAIANGIEVGVYFFSQATTVEESIEEAKFTVDLVELYPLDLPIAHDMEEVIGSEDRVNDLTNDERTEIADAFCEIVENYGYESIVYANPSWLISKLNIFKISSRKIWLAHYAESTPYPFRYEIWQYSDSGVVDGIPELVDLNIMFVRPQ